MPRSIKTLGVTGGYNDTLDSGEIQDFLLIVHAIHAPMAVLLHAPPIR